VQSWRTGNDVATRREGSIWTIAASLFCAMAANIAFSALDKLTNAIRSSVQAEAWYFHRTVYQLVLIIAVLVVGSITVSLALLWSRFRGSIFSHSIGRRLVPRSPMMTKTTLPRTLRWACGELSWCLYHAIAEDRLRAVFWFVQRKATQKPTDNQR
jgi:hypothetical protein